MKKQEHWFRQALVEAGVGSFDTAGVSIDHHAGTCTFRDRTLPVIMPWSVIRACAEISLARDLDYAFRGTRLPGREWVDRFRGMGEVAFTDRGRQIPKGEFDPEYYATLTRARFALCPAGQCPWTYRLLEAVACHAIPVCVEPWAWERSFVTLAPDGPHVYDAGVARSNYRTLLAQHSPAAIASMIGHLESGVASAS
ncbi:MAG TPA: hypothetical protein VF796_29630 [Humisphaera sp.]